MKTRKFLQCVLVGVLLSGIAVDGRAQVVRETEHVVGQGAGGPVYSLNGASLWRSDNGIAVSLAMLTPASGTYTYPGPNAFLPAAVAGSPEAFSLWMFVFNFPDQCSNPCNGDDIGAGPAMGGVFNAGGHVVGGPNLRLSGQVNMNEVPFAGVPLLNPMTAEVHIAVAPHGAVVPQLMPNQIKLPIGDPSLWWLAIFD